MSLTTKRMVRLVTLTSGSKLKFEDRLAYSILLARPNGITKAKLARLSGLDRTRTLPKVFTSLSERGLIRKDNNKYCGLPSEIVRVDAGRHGAKTWYDTVCYLKYYLPTTACPLSKKQLAVYYLKLNGKDSTSLIAAILSISRPTVIKAIKALKEAGLLDALGEPVAVSEDKSGWWQDKGKTQRQGKGQEAELIEWLAHLANQLDKSAIEWVAVHPWKSELAEFQRLCHTYGYPAGKLCSFLKKVVSNLKQAQPVAKVFRRLSILARKAEERTARNREASKYQGSSYGLFVCKVNDLTKAVKREMATR